MPALVFDCDGVLADTERFGHLPAFNRTFAEFQLPVTWSEDDYAEKLLVGGGKERMRTMLTPEFIASAGLPTDLTALAEHLARWHRRKTEIYTDIIASGAIAPRPGIARIVGEAIDEGWTLAVASTSAEAAVRSVLERAVGAERTARFAIYAGDMVPHKKPAPDIYLAALADLGVRSDDTIVIEDSRNGMRAALNAGLRCVVTTSSYTRDEDFTGAALVVSSLGDPGHNGVDTEILSDPFGIAPKPYVTLSDIGKLLQERP